MKKYLTAHVLVKNEENFIWFVLRSIIGFADRVLIFDTGSTDKTVKIIKSIKDKKVSLKECGPQTSQQLVSLRNDQIKKTKTPWFLLLDGDEVWPKKSIKTLLAEIKDADKNKIGIVTKTINCVGDIYHRLPQEKGEYRLLGKKGHLTIRAYKKSPDYFWKGTYPLLNKPALEGYFDQKNKVFLNEQEERLKFVNVSYWHLTHLKRSSKGSHQRIKYDLGIKIYPGLLPKVFFEKIPPFVPSPLKKANKAYLLVATVFSLLRKFKKIFFR